MNHRPLLAMLILAVLPRGAHAADSWKFRPGLWELTSTQVIKFPPIPSSLPPDQQAQMRAFQDRIKPPPAITTQFCMDAEHQPKTSIFDPATQAPGVCSERMLSQTDEAREIEDDCNLPLPRFNNTDPPASVPVRSTRHILLTGEGADTIDRSEIAMHQPRESLTQNFRWLSAECGTVKAAPQN